MDTRPQISPSFRFGLFEVFPESGELRRQGRKVKLQELPFRLLVALIEFSGEVVSREVLRQRLWPGDTFVEFDQGLGTAVAKLRRALDDDAGNPRFIETIPKRGYRFLAPVVHTPGQGTAEVGVATTSLAPGMPDADERPPRHIAAAPTSEGLSRPSRTRIAMAVASAGLLLAFMGAYAYRRHNEFRFTPQGTAVVADFLNTTGDEVFDDSLRQGLEVGLEQSPVISVLSDRKLAVTLRQMGLAADQRVTGKTAIEACKRNGGLVTVQGSISSLGSTYLIDLAAIRCDDEKLIANEEVQAGAKEEVVHALGSATAQLRARLGESLPSIQKYNAPLEQATTPSLDALQAYCRGLATWDRQGDRESLPDFQKAISIDPQFAMAYGALATVYHNLGETELAGNASSKAYQLRDRVTESEKLSIESRYFEYVTGELDKADEVYARAVQDSPDSVGALNHLGATEAKLGRPERAVEALRRAVQLDPTRATTYANLAQAFLRLNRLADAAAVLQQAHDRNLHTDFLLQVSYWLAFLQKDGGAMDRIIEESAGIPGAQSLLLYEQARTAGYYGRFRQAAALSRKAAESMQNDGNPESAANCLAEEAVEQAEAGLPANARSFLEQAHKLSRATDVLTLTGLAMALDGDSAQALSIANNLDKEYPKGTLVQNFWLPLIRGEVEIRKGQGSRAILLLNRAEPFDSASPDEFYVANLYPAYARGQAYLAAGDPASALKEFRKLRDQYGSVINYPLGSLAELGIARSYARMKDVEKARSAYQGFFQLWGNADPGLPVLRQARVEFRRLP